MWLAIPLSLCDSVCPHTLQSKIPPLWLEVVPHAHCDFTNSHTLFFLFFFSMDHRRLSLSSAGYRRIGHFNIVRCWIWAARSGFTLWPPSVYYKLVKVCLTVWLLPPVRHLTSRYQHLTHTYWLCLLLLLTQLAIKTAIFTFSEGGHILPCADFGF